MRLLQTAALAAVLAAAAPAFAQAPAAQTSGPNRLVAADAPPPKTVGSIDLGGEFPEMKGYTFFQSVVTVPPGTGRVLHSHKGVPELSYVVSGVLTESRNGGPPKAYGPGSTFVNDGSVSHMWANLGTETVVTINTNIRKTPAK